MPPASAFKAERSLKHLLPHIFLLELGIGPVTDQDVWPSLEKLVSET